MLADFIMPFTLFCSAVISLFSGICFIARKETFGTMIFALSWFVSLTVVIINGVVSESIPLGNMYHVMAFIPVCLFPLYFIFRKKIGVMPVSSSFAFISTLITIGAFFMRRNIYWRRPPALQSPWFIPHVTTYLIAYSLAFIAFVSLLSAISVACRRKDPTVYDKASFLLVNCLFPFMTFGLCSGAIWADAAWGSYWSWDSKETWSLIMWIFYFIYLQIPPRRIIIARTIHLFAFASLLVTFIFINLIPRLASALHGY